jgi:hypothetical protein
LAEVALLIEQADAHDRNTKVMSSLELISGNVAETTRVNRQRLPQAEFHAEVGRASERRLRIGPLKPRSGHGRPPPLEHHSGQFFQEFGVGKGVSQARPRDGLQHDLRIMGDRPKLGVQLTPDFVGAMLPTVAQIERQLFEVSHTLVSVC